MWRPLLAGSAPAGFNPMLHNSASQQQRPNICVSISRPADTTERSKILLQFVVLNVTPVLDRTSIGHRRIPDVRSVICDLYSKQTLEN